MSGSGLRSAGVRLSVEGAAEAEAAFRRVGEVGDQSMGRVGSSAQRAATALREVQPAAQRAAQGIAQVQQQSVGVAAAGSGATDSMRALATQAQALGAQVLNAATPLAGLTQGFQSFLANFGPAGAMASAVVGVAALAAGFVTVGDNGVAAGQRIQASLDAVRTTTESLGRTIGQINDLFLTQAQRATAAANASIGARRTELLVGQERLAAEQETARQQEQQAETEIVRLTRLAAANEALRARQARGGVRLDQDATGDDLQARINAARGRAGDARRAQDNAERGLQGASDASNRLRNAAVVNVDEFGPPAPERVSGGGGGASARDPDAVARERDLNRALAERASLLRGIETPYEVYARRLEEIGDLQERLPEAERLSNEQIARSTEQLAENLRRAEETSTELGNSGKLLGSAFTSAFESAIVKGEEFSVVLRGLADDLAKVILRKGITEPLGNAVSGINIGGLVNSGLNAIFGPSSGGVKAANGFAFSGGDVVPFANGGVFDSPTLFPMSGGRTGLMGEAGPEAIMPLERGPGGRLGIRAQGGGGGLTQIINIDARNADSGVDQKIRAAITIATQQANAQLLADISRGGSTAKQVGRRG